jgi:hypothetical protein
MKQLTLAAVASERYDAAMYERCCDNEGLLIHSHAGARDTVGQQRERVDAI